MFAYPDPKPVLIYTDGSCPKSSGPGGWAVILIYGEARKEIAGGFNNMTNNRMELRAAIEALEYLTRPCHIRIVINNNYVWLGITKWIAKWKLRGWRSANSQPVQNQDLWLRLEAACKRYMIEWQWTRGHNGTWATNGRMSWPASKRSLSMNSSPMTRR